MKKIYIAALLCSVSLLLSSCTGNFEDMNTNPFGVTDEELGQDNNFIGMHFPTIQKSIYWNNSGNGWEFQINQNLADDIWSGYMATPTNFAGGINTQTYFIIHGWVDYAWSQAYESVMANAIRVDEKCEQLGMDIYGHFSAINAILRVMCMERICDNYGPIIYTQYGQSLTGGTYDSGQDAYRAFFKELTEASNTLSQFAGKESASFSKFDLAYGGDLNKWLRLCNSLRLRLAMRVVKYDPQWAKTEGEAAINAPGGLMGKGDSFIISGGGWRHPLFTCSIEYNDIFISADILSILGGYNDPRLEKFASPKNGKIVGVRTGLPDLDKTAEAYKQLISNINVTADNPATLMSAAETYFLLAEAALRGWNVSGSAQQYYEAGIDASFSDWGLSAGSYAQSEAVPADWVDPLVPDFNSPAVSRISIKWDEAASNEEKLERIITQKWIANFPEGKNAWAEFRRTGYPRLFPVLKNDSQGEISTEDRVRRLPFPTSEQSDNPAGYSQAVDLLGGPDTGATRVFWDVKTGNF